MGNKVIFKDNVKFLATMKPGEILVVEVPKNLTEEEWMIYTKQLQEAALTSNIEIIIF